MTTLSTAHHPHLPAPRFEGLRHRLDGALALPGDDLYTLLATPWNVAVATRPAAVVQAASAQDVVEAVRFAAAAGLPVAVQSTGHGIAGGLDGALLVHTGRLDECVVHTDGWARVGAGVRWQQVLDAAAPHGLAPLAGSAPGVGSVTRSACQRSGPKTSYWMSRAATSRSISALRMPRMKGSGPQR